MVHQIGDEFQGAGLIVVGEPRLDLEIAQIEGIGRPQIDIAEDAGEAEHVLVLQVGTVGILIDLDREQVFAVLEIVRDVELGRCPGIL